MGSPFGRKSWRSGLLALLALCLSATLCDAASAARAPLGRGVNILSTDGMFRPGEVSLFSFDTFGRLRRYGFDHVRINALPFDRLDASGRLDERWLATLRRVIDGALAAGLQVVVDVHEFLYCQREPQACAVKLDAVWSTLALRLSDYDDRVVFEILNEPGGAMDPAAWNRLFARELAVVRRFNPHRRVIAGVAGGGHFSALKQLKLPPDDADLLVAVHYYEPFRFTHQGASWAKLADKTGVDWGAAEDYDRMDRDFAAIADWANKEKRPIYLGEFGVYERAEPRPRFCWLHRVVYDAEAEGWSWAYWQLTSDFTLLDERTGRWNDWLIAAMTGPRNPAFCAPPAPGAPVRTP
ncbi:MAG: glycoside hydrolase family 5 protein [Hyphomicrobiales bacterium]|nr:glycoside hydrolase family 5 protein [Hyphomicrobiales bacterium]